MSKSVLIQWRQQGLEKAKKSAATTKKLLLEAARGIKDVTARRAAVGQIRAEDREARGRFDDQARRLRLQARAGAIQGLAAERRAEFLGRGEQAIGRAQQVLGAIDGLAQADASSPSSVFAAASALSSAIPGGQLVGVVTGIVARVFAQWEEKEERRRLDREKALLARISRERELRQREVDERVRQAALEAARGELSEFRPRYVRRSG